MKAFSKRSARLLFKFAVITGLVGSGVSALDTQAAPIDLGMAGDYSVLAINSFQYNGPGNINGDVAVGQSINFASPATIHGTVYLNTGVAQQGNIVPTGGFVHKDLSQAISDAQAAATAANALTPTQTFTTLGNNSTVNGTGGINVIDVGSINLTNGSLTLKGTASDYFIIDDAGKFTFSNSAMVLSGGVLASHILFDIDGNVAITGGGTLDNFYGTILAPNSDVSIHDKALYGEVIGKTIEDTSGFNVNGTPFTGTILPLPKSAWAGFVTLGLIAAGAGLRHRRLALTSK